MVSPERFSNLPEHLWPRLRGLLDVHAPGDEPLLLALGEPQHKFPAFVSETIAQHADGFNKYPPNDGSPGLLGSIAEWLHGRFGVDVDPASQILALNGTREGLFNALLALCPNKKSGQTPAVLMPNPFYPVYVVGAVAGQAEPVHLAATAETGFLPDFEGVDLALLGRTAAAVICSPSNPEGVIASRDYLARLLELAEKHDFIVIADECYSEIYRDTPPPGILQVAAEIGADPERALAFHSLSKRSNLPGLRSGFVAGGPKAIAECKKLRAYAGAPLPTPLQNAAERVWGDEAHVEENRALYQEKYRLADEIFGNLPGYHAPKAGFFLWLNVGDGEAAALKLWQEAGIRVLPGEYLAVTVDGENPGKPYIRVALVAPYIELERGLKAIRACIYEQGK